MYDVFVIDVPVICGERDKYQIFRDIPEKL